MLIHHIYLLYFRCHFHVSLFTDKMASNMTLYDRKQVLLSFDESSFYYAIRYNMITSAEVCRVKYPDIKTFGDYAICPSPSRSQKQYARPYLVSILLIFVVYFTL